MKKISLCAGIICFMFMSGVSFGQQGELNDDIPYVLGGTKENIEAQQNLQPCDNILTNDYNRIETYMFRVRDVLYKGYTSDVCCRMVCLPSFFPEWLVGLQFSDFKYRVIYLQAEEKVWSGFGERKACEIDVEEITADIDSDTARELKLLFTTMLNNSINYKKSRHGHDGATYYFSMKEINKGGEIWSPDDNTNTGMLVEIGGLLANYAKAEPGKREEILSNIRAKAEELQRRLKADEVISEQD